MTTSFYNGITGLKSFQTGIDIWGDNIANINTTGYKANIPEFSTIFADTINTSPITSDIGMGSVFSSSAIDLSQGSLIKTDSPFDISLTDEGWFSVKRYDQTYYSRTGSFKKDAEGLLVDDNGDYLQGVSANNIQKDLNGNYYIDKTVNTDNLITQNKPTSNIFLPDTLTYPATATTEAVISTNLNNAETVMFPKPAQPQIDFSALYDKDGKSINLTEGNSLVFGFGNPVTYENSLISTEFCIQDDKKDSLPATYEFSVNDQKIKLIMPDGSTKEEIQKALKDELDYFGIKNEITKDGIKISAQDKLIITSQNSLVPNVASAKLTYSPNPDSDYQFSTIDDFNKILNSLAQSAYPSKVQVYLDQNGSITIQNNSDLSINSYAIKTPSSNSAFMDNLNRLGSEIYPHTTAKSFEFTANTQTFSGEIIDALSQKDTLNFTFTKQKSLPNQSIWSAKVDITDPSSNLLASQTFEITFDSKGNLITPKEVTITTPQNINLTLDLTSYAKANVVSNYSFTHNGKPAGSLERYEIENDGKITAFFTNGSASTIAQIPIYHFTNDQGLESIGGNLFRETSNSGKAFLYTDENGYIPSTSLASGALESSNVDFAQAMTELIITQKAYSSAAKTVTTSDQMIQRAIDMKKG